MDFSEYQSEAKKTAIYPGEFKIYYPALGLSGEVGEINNKIKKRIRDNTALDKEDMKKELGDILWYLSAVASDLEIDLGEVAQLNIAKLKKRMEEGKIKGSGDNR